MTFWTEGTTLTNRIWQCFVCGEKFEEYGEYAQHITKEHDEGRDFLICPIDICCAPVRDMRAHFKAKHPNRPMPKNCQMKTTVWRDFSSNGKKKTSSKPIKFNEGWHESPKNNGAKVYYRSGYEKQVYECLEKDTDVKSFVAEPFKVPYYYKNEWHNYKPDLKVEYTDGVVEIWEIKPKNQTDYEQNKAKWKAMHEYAQNIGWKFNVITETGIGKLRCKVRGK